VSKGKVQFPDSIAGRANINFDMYSGYVNITSAPDYLFYWFFSTQDGNANAPLIIWTNGKFFRLKTTIQFLNFYFTSGGPGCTSMEGATTEHGPLSLVDIKESCSNAGPSSKCDYTLQLSSNAYAWNKHANVVYLDQPKNVGYSFGYGSETKSTTEAAEDFVIFYNNWIELFPEFKNRQLIIAGESYGGHYIPAWSNAVLNFNQQNPTKAIPLSGVLIGNGCVNDTVQNTDEFIKFQHETNLIPASAKPKTYATAYSTMINNLG
jgi:cathepsin A (carboxypeptidase C)